MTGNTAAFTRIMRPFLPLLSPHITNLTWDESHHRGLSLYTLITQAWCICESLDGVERCNVTTATVSWNSVIFLICRISCISGFLNFSKTNGLKKRRRDFKVLSKFFPQKTLIQKKNPSEKVKKYFLGLLELDLNKVLFADEVQFVLKPPRLGLRATEGV